MITGPHCRHISRCLAATFVLLSIAGQAGAGDSGEEELEAPINSGRDVLFGIAIAICCLVLFFFVLAILLSIFLFICCVRFLRENKSKRKKGQDEEKGESNTSENEGRLQPLSGSVESLSNGNFKCNPQYSKVEYKSDIERSGEVAETPSSITDLTLYTIGYQKQYSVMTPTSSPAERTPVGSAKGEDYDDIYQQPPSNEKDLYSQLARRHYANAKKDSVVLSHEIGKGEFGTVWEGEWAVEEGRSRTVAIKTLNPHMSEKDRIRFLQEAVIIGQFRHPNIVRLLGVVKDGEPKMIILELTTRGDLRNLLNNLNTNTRDIPFEELPALLLKFSNQISDGMDYLAKKCFIHRDLAARNILVTEAYACKIADFGMSRDLAAESCYVSSGGLIPVRWTAPEALNYGMFSTASDVWSFGALLYEIWSLGRRPFDNIENDKVIELVQTGYRLPPPPGCPRAIYSIMISCWHPLPHLRPEFSSIRALLRKPQEEVLLEEDDENKGGNLGGPLNDGVGLYTDLQNTYKEDYESH